MPCAGVSLNSLFRAGGRLCHPAAVPRMVSGWVCDRFAGSSRHEHCRARNIRFSRWGSARKYPARPLCRFTGPFFGHVRRHCRYRLLPVIACLAAPAPSFASPETVMSPLLRALRPPPMPAPHLPPAATDLAAGDRDVISIPMHSAADTRSEHAAGGSDLAARDGDVIAILP